jgi:hypothetical protein
MIADEAPAWDALSSIDPDAVCHRTTAFFDGTLQIFKLKFFSHDLDVSLPARLISSPEPEGKVLLDKLRDYANPTILSYLIHASDVSFSGKFVNPADLAGGQIYTGGTHQLPLQLIADKYCLDRKQFMERSSMLGGQEMSLAEASLLIHPFPRIAVAILLWFQDDEFPARSTLLVDSSSQRQLPPDALWLTLMMSVMALL